MSLVCADGPTVRGLRALPARTSEAARVLLYERASSAMLGRRRACATKDLARAHDDEGLLVWLRQVAPPRPRLGGGEVFNNWNAAGMMMTMMKDMADMPSEALRRCGGAIAL
eukprot:TRINITY_DN36314_c0_g1_i1.p2 TRINITY_DN36314_c0_g1~~TRINITY_DN36314_c0_g1_i1.p2  ORF type:complete len:112 (-),score=12.16 TRINITY_DN36314_c0_g1_i1:374-709(-)